MVKTKLCKKCKKEVPIGGFYATLSPQRVSYLYNICKICTRKKRLRDYHEKKKIEGLKQRPHASLETKTKLRAVLDEILSEKA